LPSRLQVNLEIAQAVSQRRLSLSTTLYPGQKCVEASDDVIKRFYPIRTIVSNSFGADQATGAQKRWRLNSKSLTRWLHEIARDNLRFAVAASNRLLHLRGPSEDNDCAPALEPL
jgi:hypothetical protein